MGKRQENQCSGINFPFFSSCSFQLLVVLSIVVVVGGIASTLDSQEMWAAYSVCQGAQLIYGKLLKSLRVGLMWSESKYQYVYLGQTILFEIPHQKL
jgi:hypothetical protein